ncbi:protein translocase subunit SecF, partial [Streptomyces sp. SID8380]|nr:protein translocase subunit SecF [Streptomyces sp. SID8380]
REPQMKALTKRVLAKRAAAERGEGPGDGPRDGDGPQGATAAAGPVVAPARGRDGRDGRTTGKRR